ncbi:hypothetical protein AMECASPLE_035365 [Ameca splendens]|uniref:Uncharacterized protein n=1 Tax=Ameca splendens TaxID=208324 RepID=A0ABV0YIT7_9TELE
MSIRPDDDENRGLFLYVQKLTKRLLGIAGCLLAAGQRIGQGSNLATKGMAITFSTASKVKVWCRFLALRPVLLQIPDGSCELKKPCQDHPNYVNFNYSYAKILFGMYEEILSTIC